MADARTVQHARCRVKSAYGSTYNEMYHEIIDPHAILMRHARASLFLYSYSTPSPGRRRTVLASNVPSRGGRR